MAHNLRGNERESFVLHLKDHWQVPQSVAKKLNPSNTALLSILQWLVESQDLFPRYQLEWQSAARDYGDLAALLQQIAKHYQKAKNCDRQQMNRQLLLALFHRYLKPYPEVTLPKRYPIMVELNKTFDQKTTLEYG